MNAPLCRRLPETGSVRGEKTAAQPADYSATPSNRRTIIGIFATPGCSKKALGHILEYTRDESRTHDIPPYLHPASRTSSASPKPFPPKRYRCKYITKMAKFTAPREASGKPHETL
jgi:hypothetical protein